MPSDHHARVEELVADYRRSRERLAVTQQELASITETVAADGIQVTVGPQGALRDLVISDAAYQRHRPSQLAAVIVRLSAEAAGVAARRAADVLAPVLPPGTDPAALLEGRSDLGRDDSQDHNPHRPSSSHRPNTSRPPGVQDVPGNDEDFSQTSWLQRGVAKRKHP